MKRNYILFNKKNKAMKKIYFAPVTKAFEVKPTTVIAASPSVHNELGDQNQLVNEERTDLGSNNLWDEIW